MPYTFTHPGFLLPLKKWKPGLFSTTGLVFGSIAPDYDILLRLTNSRFHIFQYDWKDILFMILPLALASGIYFHLVICDVLIDKLPENLQRRLAKYKNQSFTRPLPQKMFRLIYSILFAILVHISLDFISHWDAFPFKFYAWMVYHSYWLGEIYYYSAIYIPVIVFSIVGLVLTAGYIKSFHFKMTDIRMTLKHRPFINLLITYTVISLIICIVKLYISGIESGYMIDHLVISLTHGMLLSFFITPAIFYILAIPSRLP